MVMSLDELFEGTFGGKKQDIVNSWNNWKNLYLPDGVISAYKLILWAF